MLEKVGQAVPPIGPMWDYDINCMFIAATLQWRHMSLMVSEITSNPTVYLSACPDKHQSSTNWPLVRVIQGFVPITKGQYYGKRFHVVSRLPSLIAI